MLAYSIYLFNKKSKVIVYTTGFIISEGKNLQNINFERILAIKGDIGQKVKILYLNKPFFEYSNNEMNKIYSDYKEINFDDELLEKDFINVFNIIKEQFRNYVFEKYNNDLEQVINSPYLFEQIKNNNLNFMKAKLYES